MTGGFQAGNRIELLQSGAEYFPALLAAIAEAQHEILLETYIFESDSVGLAVVEALCAAVQRGVCVRLLLDGFGAADFVRERLPALREAGVEVQVFRRELSRFALRRHRLRRLHRKLVVVDGRLAFVGGINIVDDYDGGALPAPRFDFAVRLAGPLVAEVQQAMSRLWRLVVWAGLRRRLFVGHWHVPQLGPAGMVEAAFVLRDNFRHRRAIETAYLEAIDAASERVFIANAYFFPGRAFRHALVRAARRGVKVTLLLQGRAEYRLLYHACRVLYPHLLQAGVQIVEYRKSFLHAKVAVVDADWATVGSSNIDPFSLLLAREANVLVRDADFAGQLHAALRQAANEGGAQLSLAQWGRQGFFLRALNWLAYGGLRAMLGLAGYAGRAE